MDDSTPDLWTIGHSNHPFEHFLDLLRRYEIEAVVDVRSRPYSRFVPHFGKERLEQRLTEERIAYLFLGRELGGRPVRDEEPKASLDYRARVARPDFQRGIDHLLGLARERRTALICRERDPLDCHRTHLICRHLRPRLGTITHILPDGRIEDHGATEHRLLARVAPETLPLFQTALAGEDADALDRAYDRFWPHGA